MKKGKIFGGILLMITIGINVNIKSDFESKQVNTDKYLCMAYTSLEGDEDDEGDPTIVPTGSILDWFADLFA